MNINEKNLDTIIQNYVHGRLNDVEASEFEEYFLSNPNVIEQVETTQSLHMGLLEAEKTAFQQTADSIKVSNTSTIKSTDSFYQKLLNLVSIPVPAFAVIAMAAILLPMALENFNNQNQTSEVSLINFSTQATRSSDQGITIDLSNSNNSSAILIKLKKVDYPFYKLKLINTNSNKSAWESQEFQVSALRDKLVTLPNLSSLGKVNVEVYGIDNDSQETKVDFCHYNETCR